MIYCNFCENEATGLFDPAKSIVKLPACKSHQDSVNPLFAHIHPDDDGYWEQAYKQIADVIEDKLVIKGLGYAGQCWMWIGRIFVKDGYGTLRWSRHPALVADNNLAVHRIMAEARIIMREKAMEILQVEKGRDKVCHDPYVCDWKRCCNPKHLRFARQGQNNTDNAIRRRVLSGTESQTLSLIHI